MSKSTKTTPAPPYKTLGDFIRGLRIRMGLHQKEVGAAASVSHSYLSRVEGGERRPSLRLLKRLARVLKYPYGQLAVKAGLLDAAFSSEVACDVEAHADADPTFAGEAQSETSTGGAVDQIVEALAAEGYAGAARFLLEKFGGADAGAPD